MTSGSRSNSTLWRPRRSGLRPSGRRVHRVAYDPAVNDIPALTASHLLPVAGWEIRPIARTEDGAFIGVVEAGARG
jgi:hypothetical protein